MQKSATSRWVGLAFLIVVYILAALAGMAVFRLFDGRSLYIKLLAADAAATIFTWLAGLLIKNSSVYDPYWSVAPVIMLIAIGVTRGVFNTGVLMITAVVTLWGVRLTAHWWNTFISLQHQDWRYIQLKEEHPRLWHFVNLFGIHLFPTIVVFLALAPAFYLILNFTSLRIAMLVGVLVSLSGVLLQYAADKELRQFRQKPDNAGQVNRTGIWKLSRHPNYLGEILMWWGIFLAALSAPGISPLYAAGAMLNTLMFVFISIPMMERRQLKSKPEYACYQAETRMLLPLPKHSVKEQAGRPDR